MKYILFLLLFTSPFLISAQQITFTKASYAFWDTTTISNTWWRSISQAMAATIDTIQRRMIVPNLQVWANTTSRRNLITGQNTTTGDTTISVSGTLTIRINGTPLHYNFGVNHIIYLALQDGLYAIWWGRYLAITYPKLNGFIRLVEFE